MNLIPSADPDNGSQLGPGPFCWSLYNLGSHKVAGVRKAIEATGARQLSLPAYRPDLNPIEMVFSKLKAEMRKRAIRTMDALWTAPGAIAGSLTPRQCANYLRHCGYFQSG